jgi:hypothetical protein
MGHPTPSGITFGGPPEDRERLGGCLLVDFEAEANTKPVAVDDHPRHGAVRVGPGCRVGRYLVMVPIGSERLVVELRCIEGN